VTIGNPTPLNNPREVVKVNFPKIRFTSGISNWAGSSLSGISLSRGAISFVNEGVIPIELCICQPPFSPRIMIKPACPANISIEIFKVRSKSVPKSRSWVKARKTSSK